MGYDEDVMKTIKKIYHPRIIKTITPVTKPPVKVQEFLMADGQYPDTVRGVRKRCFRNRIFIDLRCFEEECPYLEHKNEAECMCTFFKKEKETKKTRGMKPELVITDAINDLMYKCYSDADVPKWITLHPTNFDIFVDYLKNMKEFELGIGKWGRQVQYRGITIFLNSDVAIDEVRLIGETDKKYVIRLEV